MFKPKLREYTAKALTDRTVEVMTGAMVASVSPTRVTLKSGEELKAHTLVWGAGLQGNRLVQTLGLELQRGNRIGVGPDLALPDHPEVYVLGDIAAIVDEKTQQVLPQLGSVALQSGEHAGDDRPPDRGQGAKPFKYRDKGTMAAIGRGAAVVQMLGGRTMTGQEGAARVGHGASGAAADERGPREGGRRLGRSHVTHQRAGRITVGERVAAVTVASTVVDLARVQFATTSIYHFLFVPLTLGLGPLVAVMQTLWHRTRDEAGCG